MKLVVDTNMPSTAMEKSGKPASLGLVICFCTLLSTLVILSSHKKVTEITAFQGSNHRQPCTTSPNQSDQLLTCIWFLLGGNQGTIPTQPLLPISRPCCYEANSPQLPNKGELHLNRLSASCTSGQALKQLASFCRLRWACRTNPAC